jgi:hypothetical protein
MDMLQVDLMGNNKWRKDNESIWIAK